MKPAKKWNIKKQTYKDIFIDGRCEIYCKDMGQMVVCPICNTELVFGRTYTSRQIFDESGCFGYGICEECHAKEYEEEFSHRKMKWDND